MPLYEYACGECGTHMEVRQRISEDPLTTCPRCETDALERLVSMTSFALKGGGWYADGYGDGKKPTSSETKSASNDASKGSTADAPKKADKAETKTEAAPSKAAANG